MEQQKKPKYKIKEKLWGEWHGIIQVANNVVVAYVGNLQMAELLLEILNDLPKRAVIHIRNKRIYNHIRRSEKEDD